MTGTVTFNSFAIDSADIALYNSGAAASWVSVPLAAEGTLETTMTTADVTDGEGRIEDQWHHSQRATVRLRAKRVFMRILELISGNTVSSTAGTERIEFGTDAEITPPLVRLRLKAKARDATADTTGYVYVVLYKCKGSIGGLTFAETTPGEITAVFNALQSLTRDDGSVIGGNGAFGHVQAVAST